MLFLHGASKMTHGDFLRWYASEYGFAVRKQEDKRIG